MDVRLASERVVTVEVGRIVELLVEPFPANCPKSDMWGLRVPEEVDASLRRTRDVCGVCGGYLARDEDEAMYSSYRVDESAVETDVLGDPGRCSCACNS